MVVTRKDHDADDAGPRLHGAQGHLWLVLVDTPMRRW